MTSETEIQTETKTEHWTYLGEQPGSTVKKVAVWRKQDQTIVAYKNTPPVRGVVGMIYEIPIDDDGSARVSLNKWTGLEAIDKASLQLEADAYRRRFARELEATKAKENEPVKRLLEHAGNLAENLSWNAREELITQLRRTILSR